MIDAFERSLRTLRAYEIDRKRIDNLCENDVDVRMKPPEVKGASSRSELIEFVNQELTSGKLVGYHCSRLEATEVESILQTGLRPLDKTLVDERIKRQLALGHLSQYVAQRLQRENAMNDNTAGQRIGMIHFCFSQALLKDESGVGRLFACWGGEALYRGLEKDSFVGPEIRKIGRPAIVVAAVSIPAIETFLSVGERLLNVFLEKRGISTAHRPEFEGHTCEPVPDIIRVVMAGEPMFEELTNFDSWSYPPI